MPDVTPPPYPGDSNASGGLPAAPPPPPPGSTPPPDVPPQYAPHPTGPPTNGLAIASLILGVAGILGLCCYGFGLLPGIAAIVCGHLAKKAIRASNGTQSGEGLANAGLITGIIATVLGTLMIVAVIALIGLSAVGSIPGNY